MAVRFTAFQAARHTLKKYDELAGPATRLGRPAAGSFTDSGGRCAGKFLDRGRI